MHWAYGTTRKKDEKYYCPVEVATLLSRDSPTSIMPLIMLAVGDWKRWSDLTEIIRYGSQRTRPSVFDNSEREQEMFIG